MDHKIFSELYGIDTELGCLQRCADSLQPPFDEWLEVAQRLPELLLRGTACDEIARLAITKKALEKPMPPAQARLLFRTATFLGAAWVWGATPPTASIKSPLSAVLVYLARRLGMKSILSYAPFLLWNWELIDPDGKLEPDNIELQQYFLRTEDARWFNAIHVAIEASAARIPSLLAELHHARIADDAVRMITLLRECAGILEKMNAHLRRMPEHCNPGAYFSMVRPYIQGFRLHPVIYSGFWDDVPQDFWGESGSQSLIVPALDCAFGIPHRTDGAFAEYLRDMPNYMPSHHRQYLKDLAILTQQGDESLLLYALGCQRTYPALCEELHRSLMLMVEFSEIHFGYPQRYIQDQTAHSSAYNRSDVGTGGTPYMQYLRQHIEDRRRFAELLA
ncbi:MAG: hypothetical protein Q8R39_03610 [bacterium]|nr:hypothetical protein [bacterium]MDZ4284257.1 hypothetical protein [Patescibacteria group bacterium]